MLLIQKVLLLVQISFQFFPFGCTEITFEKVLETFYRIRRECETRDYPYYTPDMYDSYCNASGDRFLSCWVPTKRNTTATVTCPHLFFLPDKLNRTCRADGTWSRNDYSKECRHLDRDEYLRRRAVFFQETGIATAEELEEEAFERHLNVVLVYYRIGLYAFDSLVCCIALIFIAVFIPVKEKRFNLHACLIFSCLARDCCLIAMFSILRQDTDIIETRPCNSILLIYYYVALAQVFTMFVEGYYQFHRFFYVFKKDINIYKYLAVAWTIPLVIVFGIYLPAMLLDPPLEGRVSVCWVQYNVYKYNYIFIGPLVLVLAINLGFMIYLMRLVYTKLRSDKSAAEANRVWRTIRGFLILLFLLGGGHVMAIYTGQKARFMFFTELLNGLQGSMVCLFQVLFSKQLKSSIRKKLRRHIAKKSVGKSTTKAKSTFQEATNNPLKKSGSDQAIYVIADRDEQNVIIHRSNENVQKASSSDELNIHQDQVDNIIVCHNFSRKEESNGDNNTANEISESHCNQNNVDQTGESERFLTSSNAQASNELEEKDTQVYLEQVNDECQTPNAVVIKCDDSKPNITFDEEASREHIEKNNQGNIGFEKLEDCDRQESENEQKGDIFQSKPPKADEEKNEENHCKVNQKLLSADIASSEADNYIDETTDVALCNEDNCINNSTDIASIEEDNYINDVASCNEDLEDTNSKNEKMSLNTNEEPKEEVSSLPLNSEDTQ